MAAKRKPQTKQAPSETYAARAARGRRLISLGLPADALIELDSMAERRGMSRAQVVTELILHETIRRDRNP